MLRYLAVHHSLFGGTGYLSHFHWSIAILVIAAGGLFGAWLNSRNGGS